LCGLTFIFAAVCFLLVLSAIKYQRVGMFGMRNWTVAAAISCIGLVFYLWSV